MVNCPLCQSENSNEKPWLHWDQKFYGQNVKKSYFKCGSCHLIYLDPVHYMDSDQEKGRYLQHKNDLFDQRYLNYLERLWSPLRLSLPSQNQYLGLDYGCGPTKGLEQLLSHENQFDVMSYDPFFHQGYKGSPVSLDFVYCNEAIEHFHNPMDDLKKLKSLLNPGGILGIGTQAPPSDPEAFKKWNYALDPTHVCFYSPMTFKWVSKALKLNIKFIDPPIFIFENFE